MPVLHQITPRMTAHYKAIRLRALADSPTAFGSTYEGESQFKDEVWDTRSRNLDGERGLGYLALDGEEFGGLAIGLLDEFHKKRAELISMWVAPAYRRAGVGRLLVDAIESWALGRGAESLELMVTSSNHGAMRFYERLGFAMTGRTEPYPNDGALVEYEMTKHLGRGSSSLEPTA